MIQQLQNQQGFFFYYRPEKDLNKNSVNIIANNTTEFYYDPHGGKLLLYTSNDGLIIFNNRFSQKEHWKIRQPIRKLGIQEQDCYTNILPKQPTDFTITETVERLKNIWRKTATIQHPLKLSRINTK